jgi:hypothetical protein
MRATPVLNPFEILVALTVVFAFLLAAAGVVYAAGKVWERVRATALEPRTDTRFR